MLNDYVGCPVRPVPYDCSIDDAWAIARSIKHVNESCFVALDEHACRLGSGDRGLQGITGESNKVAGGNFFWAAPERDIDLEAIRALADTHGDLFSSGALGMGVRKEFLSSFLESAVKARDQVEEEHEIVPPLKAAEGMVLLRDIGDAWELYSFDLKSFARSCGFSGPAVVVLPSSFDGKPITKASTNALARACVQGVRVAYLWLPEDLAEVPSGLLSFVSAETIFLGKRVSRFGVQQNDLSLFSPRLETRRYVVDPCNEHLSSVNGMLASKDGSIVYHIPPPYGDNLVLPHSMRVLAEQSLCTGVAKPSIVEFSSVLEEVNGKSLDSSVWVGEPSVRLAAQFESRSIRFARNVFSGPNGCVYELADAHARLIAGPPQTASASQTFARVRAQSAFGEERIKWFMSEQGESGNLLTVGTDPHGQVVSCIAPYALLFAPKNLELHGCVKVVGNGNSAKGCTRLVLHEGIKTIGDDCFVSRCLEPPVVIPTSVEAIGRGSFQYAVCLFRHDDSIVHVPADALKSPFTGCGEAGVPYDLETYDKAIVDGSNIPDRIGACIHRIAMHAPMSQGVRAVVLSTIERHEDDALAKVVSEGDSRIIDALFDEGYLNTRRMNTLMELLRAANRMDCLMHAMGLARNNGSAGGVVARFNL